MTITEKSILVKHNGGIDRNTLLALEIPNIEHEISEMTRGIYFQPPRVRIEHSASGRHRLFLDYGASYDCTDADQIDLPNNELSGIVCYAQMIRAMWVENELLPTCASVDDRPSVSEPISQSCMDCRYNHLGSPCKSKVRLLILTWIENDAKLVVFNLSPTSIKRWRGHITKLARTKAPYIAVISRFSLIDVRKNSFRWAEVDIGVDRIASKDELKAALDIREQVQQHFRSVDDDDYADPGDRMRGGK